MVLAGRMDLVGDSLIGMLGGWADKGLPVALTVIVIVTIVKNLSFKAAIGALLALALAIGIYQSRGSLAGLFSDEINNPSTGAGVTGPVVPGERGVL
ncbi:hypothetical protein [Streptomyces sp. NPDC089799]|uniref:hypothetical protein n=1 Tax=Streptomyces sp. NPDC089799 TaxID=3155066 RepID=UPI00342559A4